MVWESNVSVPPEPTRLAIHGGPPALPLGPPPWPPADPEIAEVLARAAADGSWGHYDGPALDALREQLGRLCGVEHVWPCASGTVAMQLALRGAAVLPGDEVLLAAYDYPGNFRAIEAVGARPVLVDIDPATLALDPARLDEAASPAVRAVVVSHLHGGLAPLGRLRAWAEGRGVVLIEDACQAIGARVEGRPVGSGGHVATLSFGGSKLVSAGRGGAVLSARADIAQRVKVAAQQGNDAYPLSVLQALVIGPQLARLAERHARRRRQARRFVERLAAENVAGVRPAIRDDDPSRDPAYYKLALWWEPAAAGGVPDRSALLAALEAEGLAAGAGFRGFLHRGERRCRRTGPLDAAGRAAEGLVLLHHPVLLADDATVERAAWAVAKVIRGWEGAA